MPTPRIPIAILLTAGWLLPAAVLAQPLTLDAAIALARTADEPELQRFEQRALALENEAVADAQLPDPVVTGHVANVPVDSFELDQDNMTQALRIGLRQEFPAGRTRALRGARRGAESAVARTQKALALREIELEVRNAWLALAWHERAQAILHDSRGAIEEQIDSLSARFASGGIHAQDISRAELELALLEDELTEHRRKSDSARAALARYIGNAAFRPLPVELPAMPEPAPMEVLERRLTEHPAARAERKRIDAAEFGVAIAEQAYKPKLALEGGYGLRADRADLATIGVTLSIPLFTDRRQDRRRAAAVQQMSAAELDHHALLLDLRRRLEQALVDWQRLQERLALYAETIGARAARTAEASVSTYASGQTDFAELIRDQLAQIRVRLKRAELVTEAAKSWARLNYLVGDPS
mgnify:CR=1 FL=1